MRTNNSDIMTVRNNINVHHDYYCYDHYHIVAFVNDLHVQFTRFRPTSAHFPVM